MWESVGFVLAICQGTGSLGERDVSLPFHRTSSHQHLLSAPCRPGGVSWIASSQCHRRVLVEQPAPAAKLWRHHRLHRMPLPRRASRRGCARMAVDTTARIVSRLGELLCGGGTALLATHQPMQTRVLNGTVDGLVCDEAMAIAIAGVGRRHGVRQLPLLLLSRAVVL